MEKKQKNSLTIKFPFNSDGVKFSTFKYEYLQSRPTLLPKSIDAIKGIISLET